MIELNKIYNEDCLEGMKRIPDRTVDLIATDPPYGINYQSNFKKQKFKTIHNDDSLSWFQGFADECYRVLKDNKE